MKHTARRDDDVVDVGATARDPAIVQHHQTLAGKPVETRAERFLADGALLPGSHRLRLVGHGEKQLPDARMPSERFALTLVGAARPFPAGRCARFADGGEQSLVGSALGEFRCVGRGHGTGRFVGRCILASDGR